MPDSQTQDHTFPKSYLAEEYKKDIPENDIYLAESEEAQDAGDMESSWAWLARADVPKHAILALADIYGEEFVKSKGFKV